MNLLWRMQTMLLSGAEGAEEVPAASAMDTLLMFAPMILIVVAFYFFLIRPESKKKKKAAAMRNELIVGDEVTTIGGIVGKVVAIKDDTLTIESGSEKSRIKIMRWAISSKGAQISE